MVRLVVRLGLFVDHFQQGSTRLDSKLAQEVVRVNCETSDLADQVVFKVQLSPFEILQGSGHNPSAGNDSLDYHAKVDLLAVKVSIVQGILLLNSEHLLAKILGFRASSEVSRLSDN